MKVFIGWDSRIPTAAEVAKSSILKHSPNTEVHFIKQFEMRHRGAYSRAVDRNASTEFTITRFLTPYLTEYKGYSLFIDCDVILTTDIQKIMDEADLSKAVNCVQHDYTNFHNTSVKMDGQKNEMYPRKNWSSVMLFNGPKCKNLLSNLYVNIALPSQLHRMEWAGDDIGELHHRWNYLAGYYNDGYPNLIHYTDGGPWFEEYRDCPMNTLWYREFFDMYGGYDYFHISEKMK